QVDVTVTGDLATLGEIRSFTIGGAQVIEPRWSDPSTVTVTLQGTLRPERHTVEIDGSLGRTVQHHIFIYDPPPQPVPLTWMASGASFTHGPESMGIDPHTQRHGVAAHIARTAGVWLGLPLFNPKLAPPLQPSDFTLDCAQKPGTGINPNNLTDVLIS